VAGDLYVDADDGFMRMRHEEKARRKFVGCDSLRCRSLAQRGIVLRFETF